MKNIILIMLIIFSNLFYAQINLKINKTNGIFSYPISEIDSSFIDLNSNSKKIVLLNGTIENHLLSEIINVTFTQPIFPNGTIHCDPSNPTAVVDVINPTTGKTWMDRNLGASQVATSSTDAAAYGDLYQWGRGADGHQCRNSATTTTLSSTDQPGHGDFISVIGDWRSPQNTNLWQGTNGINNPCPSGYRIPTESELNSERLSWINSNASGAFTSPIKLPLGGFRININGTLNNVGINGYYWSSLASNGNSGYLYIYGNFSGLGNFDRAMGLSVRCIKDVLPDPSYPPGTVHCLGTPTAVVDVTNPTTGRTWMDRNLGASQVATSSMDAAAYGDLYQWGRRSDGHQCRNSATTTTVSSTNTPTHGNFILTNNWLNNWRIPENTNLWQGVNGINNPCPIGYRLPTETELNVERTSWSSNNSAGAFASPLKLSSAGYRFHQSGSFSNTGSVGYYWSSTVSDIYSRTITITSTSTYMTNLSRADGYSVRCIKAPPGAIGVLDCNGLTTTGTLFANTASSGVSASVPYTGGNGETHSGQIVSSTVVTGLTATLAAGNFASGAGSLTYSITGIPSSTGTAIFTLNVGGQSCTIAIVVYAPYPAGTVHCLSIPTAVVDVINPATGKTWMDRNLGASQVATSSTDAAAYGDLYQWGRRADGHQCRNSAITSILNSTDQPGHGSFVITNTSPFDWRSPENNNLWQGVNGVNNPCPSGYRLPTETELNVERTSWSSNNSAGAFATPLKLPMAGERISSGGSSSGGRGAYWSSTVSSVQSRFLYFQGGNSGMGTHRRANGFSVRCFKDDPNASPIEGAIGTLNCTEATITNTLVANTAASGVSTAVPYTGGNGGTHSGQIVSSTGVTGLTATLAAGTFANGAGTLTYTITGTPSAAGIANFAINIGGQSCSLAITVSSAGSGTYPPGTVHCLTAPTAVVDVTNPTTGRTWMDRNLGASQVATSSTDAAAYGDLYQWGRRADGHQCRNSAITSILNSTDQPGHGSFVITNTSPFDWRSPQNTNLWQGVNGVNNPCPSGYRLPTQTELNAERLSWSSNNAVGAFASPLKLPMAGFRTIDFGSLNLVGTRGCYWSSTVSSTNSRDLHFISSDATTGTFNRAVGRSVRCIKD